MDKQKKEGNIKKSNLYLPTARGTARTVGARGTARTIEREIERETVGDSGGRWGTVGDSGEEGWERERVRSAREANVEGTET